jgi:hypothetical protein
MSRLNKNKTGLALGAYFVVLSLIWVIAVALGWAQPFINWVCKIKFVQPVYTIAPFDWGTAVILLIFSAVLGYILGWVLATIWNRIHS